MGSPPIRIRILERRKRFVAAALTTAGVASCTPGAGSGEPNVTPIATPVIAPAETPDEDAAIATEHDSTSEASALEPGPERELGPSICLSDDIIEGELKPTEP
jgi:hypothetical protein